MEKGLAFLSCEAAFILYMVFAGWKYLSKFGTLGTVETTKSRRVTVYGDNSFLILLFGLLTIILIVFLILVWRMNMRENRDEELILRKGGHLPSNRKVLGSLLDSNFDKTLLPSAAAESAPPSSPFWHGPWYGLSSPLSWIISWAWRWPS